MKAPKTLQAGLLSAVLFILNSHLSTAHAQTTAFTYQGRLSDGDHPANGTNYMNISPPTGNLCFQLKQ